MISRSKSRKTIGPCSRSLQASTFRRFPMIPLEEREGRGTWVMGGVALVSLVSGVRSCKRVCVDSGGCTGREAGRLGSCSGRERGWIGRWWHGQMDHNETVFFSLSLENNEWHSDVVVMIVHDERAKKNSFSTNKKDNHSVSMPVTVYTEDGFAPAVRTPTLIRHPSPTTHTSTQKHTPYTSETLTFKIQEKMRTVF